MAAPRPFGRGPFGAGPYSRNRAVVYEVGGISLLSFDAHGAAALAWARLPALCNTGLWTPTAPCGGVVADTRGYSDGAYSAGPWPGGVAPPWRPIDVCNTGTWTKQRLPELEPA